MISFRSFFVGLLLAVLCAVNSAAPTCNVETQNIDTELALQGTISTSALTILQFAQTLNGGGVRISEDDQVTGSFFFTTQQRLADGFSAAFTFVVRSGQTDGVAFVVQNEKISNVAGLSGAGLGVSGAFDSYLAVGVDVCSNRVDSPSCEESLFIEIRVSGGTVQRLAEVQLVGAAAVLKNGNAHTVTVNYLEDLNTVNVFVDNSATVTVSTTLPVDLETLFGSKFAFSGFTSSSSTSPAVLDVLALELRLLNSASRLSKTFSVDTVVDFGKQVQYELVLVDTCDAQLSLQSVIALNVSSDNVTATLTQNADSVEAGATPIKLIGVVVQSATTGSFSIFFDMPFSIISEWDLEIRVQDILSQDMPAAKVLKTVKPGENGLDRQGVILLSCLIVVLVLLTVYMIRRLDQYRRKLRKHKEDIEFGKTKEQIEKIDATISYTMNPMVGDLDEMKAKLAANLELLEKLRSGKMQQEDSNYTIEQLTAENEKLRREINDMKKEEQMYEAQGTDGNRNVKKFGGTERKEFQQQKG